MVGIVVEVAVAWIERVVAVVGGGSVEGRVEGVAVAGMRVVVAVAVALFVELMRVIEVEVGIERSFVV